MKVVLGRVSVPVASAPVYDPKEENQFRADVERAFLKLPASASSGGGGGGGGGSGDLTAKYLLDSPAVDLTSALVIHRALGPDRVPASPSVNDDEMTDPTTGYNPLKWTVFSHGSETYALDPLGGLKITPTNDSTIRGIVQAVSLTGVSWSFQTKVCLGVPGSASNSHAGIMLRQASNGYIRIFTIGSVSGSARLSVFEFSSPSSFTDTVVTSSKVDHGDGDWIYLRARGVGLSTSHTLEYSWNGVAWRTLVDGAVFPDAVEEIGLVVYQGDSNVGPSFFQHFRRTV